LHLEGIYIFGALYMHYTLKHAPLPYQNYKVNI
jgi:hypothetical protein